MNTTRGGSTSVLTEEGGSVAAIAAGVSQPGSVADCDSALRLLRVASRSGPVEARELTRLQIDAVLDRRLELVRSERKRKGA